MTVENLLSAHQLAAVLDVKPATIRRWARDGVIPQIRISPKVMRFCYADVLVALREHSGKTTVGGKAHD